jgi:hypothetical protein
MAVLGTESASDAARERLRNASGNSAPDNVSLGTQRVYRDLVTPADARGKGIPELGILKWLKGSDQTHIRAWDVAIETALMDRIDSTNLVDLAILSALPGGTGRERAQDGTKGAFIRIVLLQLASIFSLLGDQRAGAYIAGLIWYLLHSAQQFTRMLFIQPRDDGLADD